MGDVGWIATRLGEWVAGGGRLLFLTGYDGTLTPIVPNPDEAWVPGALREDLRALARAPGVDLGIVSGRDLVDVRDRVGVMEAIYAGSHGLEIEGPGLRFLHPEAEAQRGDLVSMSVTLSLRAGAVPGMRVELKRFGVAIHYRHVDADQRRRVETELARAIHQEGGRVRVFHGNRVIEVLPQVAWGKGSVPSGSATRPVAPPGLP